MPEKIKYTDIIVEKKYPFKDRPDTAIGYITINRPEKRNALSSKEGGSIPQLLQAYQEMAEDPHVRVFILKGNGDCFCAGFDMSQYDEGYWKPGSSPLRKGREKEVWSTLVGNQDNPESAFSYPMFWRELWDNPKPSIALVHSFCLGAGMANINFCDVVFATPEAVFAYPPVRYGASVWPGALQPWLLGLRKSMDMALTGRLISAQEAYDCGLITKIVTEESMLAEGQKLAESIAKVPPMTNYFSKQTIHSFYEGLAIKTWYTAAQANCIITEQSSLPGHYWDFFDIVRKKGFKQAYQEQREKWGYPDPVMEGEVKRLAAKKKGKK